MTYAKYYLEHDSTRASVDGEAAAKRHSRKANVKEFGLGIFVDSMDVHRVEFLVLGKQGHSGTRDL
jgi:hypothetical protein